MKRLTILILLMLGSKAGLRAQDTTDHISIGIDLGRLGGDLLYSNNLHLESVLRYHFGRNAFRLGIGYGQGHIDDTIYNNIFSYRVGGVFVKPGFEVYTEDRKFNCGFDFGVSFMKESGQYHIAGPYWGDYTGAYALKAKTYFSDFFISYNFFSKGPLSYGAGCNMSFFWPPLLPSTVHIPRYVPGFGATRVYCGFHLLGTINYHLGG